MESSCLARCILRFTERLQREDVNMHGFLLSVSGREIAKAYWFPFREGLPHRLYSVSKTFTGIAVGMLAEDGLLSLDQPVALICCSACGTALSLFGADVPLIR